MTGVDTEGDLTEVSTAERRRLGPLELTGWALLVLVVVLLGTTGLSRGHLMTGDTNRVVSGTRLLLDCIHERHFERCAPVPGTKTETYLGTFPPLQYGPTIVFEKFLGFNERETLEALGKLNFACLVLLVVVLLRWAVRSRSPWPPLAGALLVSGPMLVYGTAGFAEMLAAVMTVAFVLSVRSRRLVLIALTTFLVTISKETMAPFIVALAILVGRDEKDRWLPPARVLWALVPGLIAGNLLNFALNWIRYGSILNRRYLEPFMQAKGVARVGENFVDVFVAPGGGLAPFWPSYVLALVAFVAAAVVATRRRDLFGSLGMWLTLGLLAAFALGLARWWAPYGWVAWGPRLLLPLLPAYGLAMIWVGGADFLGVVRRALASTPWTVLAALTLVVGGYVAASGAWFVRPAVATIVQGDPTCPPAIGPTSPRFWHCFDERSWRITDGPIAVAARRHDTASTAARAAAMASGVALLVGARRRSRDDAAT